MAKKIKKVLSAEEKAQRKLVRNAELAAKVVKAKEKYKANNAAYTLRATRKLLSAVIGIPLDWPTFCQRKADAWLSVKTTPPRIARKPLTAEAVAKLKEKLLKQVERLERNKQLLAEAQKMLSH